MELRVLNAGEVKNGARVIVRADLDVTIKNGRVEDDTRIRAHEATLRLLLARGARIRVMAHLGRPGGAPDKKYTLAPIAPVLSRLLRRRVIFVSDPFSSASYEKWNGTDDAVLFENLRFWPGEEKNSAAFARSLARWGDLYVNEAFAAHRAHASIVRLPHLLPAYAGLHLAEEIAVLERVMDHPRRPLVAVLGGAKIEIKLPLIKRFLRDADRVLIGGALANTAFSLMGKGVGKSRVDKDVRVSASIFSHKKLFLPVDAVAARSLIPGSAHEVRGIAEVAADEYIVDIGPRTRILFASLLKDTKTVVWNGPMGLAEIPAYAKGTQALAQAVVRSASFNVVGGGDTVAALRRLHALKGFGHVSTGGGAMLEFLAGKKLPALEVLKKQYAKDKR